MKAVALLVAAGRGERMGGTAPKAFAKLAGKTLLAHAVEAADASPDVEAIVVAAPPGREDEAKAVAGASAKLHAIVAGGETRQASVRAALGAAPEGLDAVVCHDVARPLAGPELFGAVLSALDAADGVVPVVPIVDTVKRVKGEAVAGTVARDGLALAQTPQAFRRAALERAHEAAASEGIEGTDDAALLEQAGFRVWAVPGDPENVKVTEPGDLLLAEAILRSREDRR